MKKLIASFLETLNLSKTKIHKFPSKIFLCGGPKESLSKKGWASARHFIAEHVRNKYPDLSKDIVLAEVHVDWRSGTHYKTLLDVELDIVNLAKIIVIFLESPGAIAELGSFSMINDVREKIHIFVQHEHYDKRSFIFDGLVAYADMSVPQSRVYAYEWKIKKKGLADHKEFARHADDIVNDIQSALDQPWHEIEFDGAHSGHQILFLNQVIYIFSALSLSECIGIMCRLFLLTKKEVLSRLYALERLGLIKKEAYGKNSYYMPTGESLPCTFFSRKTGRQIDSIAYMVGLREQIHRADDKRFGVITKYAPR